MISVKIDLKSIKTTLDKVKKDIAFVRSVALNETAKQVVEDLKKEVKHTFKNPTPYTVNAFYIIFSNKNKPDKGAVVKIKDEAGKGTPQVNYLYPQVMGGDRRAKRSEVWMRRAGIMADNQFWVPGWKVPTDQYGNVKGGYMTRVLSVLQAHPDQYSRSTINSGKRNKAVAKMQANLVVRKKGIWEKTNNSFVPILLFVDKPRYTKRFPFHATATSSFNRNYLRIYNDNWRKYHK